MTKEDYVSFEIAKLLKEKGFYQDYYLFPVYWMNGNNVILSFEGDDDFPYGNNECVAPSLSVAMKWLRDVHHIYVKISFRFCCNADDDIEYCYDVWKHTDKYVVGQHYSDGGFMSNEEAVEAALKYSLTNLI